MQPLAKYTYEICYIRQVATPFPAEFWDLWWFSVFTRQRDSWLISHSRCDRLMLLVHITEPTSCSPSTRLCQLGSVPGNIRPQNDAILLAISKRLVI